jgi:hypothetical protein
VFSFPRRTTHQATQSNTPKYNPIITQSRAVIRETVVIVEPS